MGSMNGKVAVVTGAARGIGAATALRLAQEGARVAVVDRDETAIAETVRRISDAGGDAMECRCDVTDADAVARTTLQVVDTWDRLDILVNNAGVIRDNLLFRMSESDWDTVISVHLKGTFLFSRAAQSFMVKQKFGKIVNVSSTSALGNRGQANYSAAKAGIQGLTKTLALELGPFNINVNAVAPGFIDTDMTRETALRMGLSADDFQKLASEHIPLGRIGQPQEVASVIAFLASDDASYVSGQIIYVNGGGR